MQEACVWLCAAPPPGTGSVRWHLRSLFFRFLTVCLPCVCRKPTESESAPARVSNVLSVTEKDVWGGYKARSPRAG